MLFKDLSSPAKIVYHVTRRIKNHQTESFFHAVNTLATLTGISERSCQYALNELVNHGILKRTERPGHSTLYTFIQTADLAATLHPSPAEFAPHPRKICTHNNSDLTDSDLTTTEWLTEKLSNTLVAKYGPQAVSDRVVVISKMNGKIGNKAGLLVASLKGNYIPASKELREAEERQRITLAIEAKSEKQSQEYEKMIQEREKSSGKIDLTSEFEKLIAKIGKEN